MFPQADCQLYECTYAGRFSYHYANCKSYYICGWGGSNLIKSNYTCPTTTLFDPRSQKCSTSYICVDSICNRTGVSQNQMFYNPNGSGCSSFVICVFDSLGTMLIPVYGQCPSGSLFDPSLCYDQTTAGACVDGVNDCIC